MSVLDHWLDSIACTIFQRYYTPMKVFVCTYVPRGDGVIELVQREHEATFNIDEVAADNGSILWAEGKWYQREQFGNGRKLNVLTGSIEVDDVPKEMRLRVLLLT